MHAGVFSDRNRASNGPRIRPPAGQSLWSRAAQQWLIPSEPSRIEKSVIRRPRTFLLGYVPASGTRDLAVRFDSKTNGTGTLRQFVSKATRPKLPGGLLLSPVCPACLVQRTAERPASGDRRVTSCTARRARPSYRASWPLNRFPSSLNTARMPTCGYRDGGGRHLLNAPPWR